MDSKDQNLDLTQTKRIHLCPFQFIFVCWEKIYVLKVKIINFHIVPWIHTQPQIAVIVVY